MDNDEGQAAVEDGEAQFWSWFCTWRDAFASSGREELQALHERLQHEAWGLLIKPCMFHCFQAWFLSLSDSSKCVGYGNGPDDYDGDGEDDNCQDELGAASGDACCSSELDNCGSEALAGSQGCHHLSGVVPLVDGREYGVDCGSRIGRWRGKCLQAAIVGTCYGALRHRAKRFFLKKCGNNDRSGLGGTLPEA